MFRGASCEDQRKQSALPLNLSAEPMSANVLALLPSATRAGRLPRHIDDPVSRACSLIPVRGGGSTELYLYAIGFSGDFVKVGVTSRPRGRFREHYRAAKGDVKWMHLFGGPLGYSLARLSEREAVKALSVLGVRVNHGEWFRCSADKLTVLRVVRQAIEQADAHLNQQDE
jgi:hypothetical protein